jgi:hypothetical protein
MRADQLPNNEKSKSERYKDLIAEFKKYEFKEHLPLLNPHHVKGFNFEVINPWELWHNNLDAEIMFIGQDFSDSTNLIEGLKNNWETEREKSPTNKKLIRLFKELEPKFHFPEVNYASETEYPLFFTNAVLGIKKTASKNMALSIKNIWWRETAEKYLKGLIDIVQPKYIITMSMTAYKAICYIYKETPEKTVGGAISRNGNRKNLQGGIKLFVVNHCSPNGLRTRNFDAQIGDWQTIKNDISKV